MVDLIDKIEKIEKEIEVIKAQKQQYINQDLTRNKKDELRLQILIGTAILEDLKNTFEIDMEAYRNKKASLKTILDKAITTKSSRDFLKLYDYI